MLLREGFVLSKIPVIVRRFFQTLQAHNMHKLNMIKREKLARHPRTIWRIWACDVTPTSRMFASPLIQYSRGVGGRQRKRREAKAGIKWLCPPPPPHTHTHTHTHTRDHPPDHAHISSCTVAKTIRSTSLRHRSISNRRRSESLCCLRQVNSGERCWTVQCWTVEVELLACQSATC